MKQKRDQKKKPAQQKTGESVSGRPTKKSDEKRKELLNEMDDILDEIDEVLEENAAEFVKNYVQRGGQ